MKTMKCLNIALTLVAASVAIRATADPGSMSTPMMKPTTAQQFVNDAAIGGMKDIRLSQMAAEASRNPEVKKFARRMMTDHQAINNKLEILVNQNGLIYPPTNIFAADDPNWRNPAIENPASVKGTYLLTTNLPNAVDYQVIKRLRTLSGREFDVEYVRQMVIDHINTIDEFAAWSHQPPDPVFGKFAADMLPTLRERSRMAEKLQNQLARQTADDRGKMRSKESATAKR